MHKKVNQSQQKAIQHGTGPALVLAGPGSGKTFVITNRIKHLIESYHIPPENILVITFTKASALEMEERFRILMQGDFYPVTFGTFHAIFFHILQYKYQFNYSNIIKESEKHQYIQEILENMRANQKTVASNDNAQSNRKTVSDANMQTDYQELSKDEISMILNEISNVKNKGISIEKYQSISMEPCIFQQIFKAYRVYFQRNRKLDFDDMVLLCYELLKNDPHMRRFWQERYRYILIDEFQDINLLQYRTIKLLSEPEQNLFVVGDDDQSIYGFRGSNPQILKRFEEEYSSVEKILLDKNYRCSGAIVDASIKLIRENVHRYDKTIESHNDTGEAIVKYGFHSQEEEHENIRNLVETMHKMGIPYREIAIIYRTNEGMGSVAEKLLEKQIPVQMKEKVTCIYEHFLVKDILAYMRFALDSNRKDFLQIMNKPKRYLSRKACQKEQISFQELQRYYGDQYYMQDKIRRLEYHIRQLKRMNPYAAINYIRKGINYDEYVMEYGKKQGVDCRQWIQMLDKVQESAERYLTIEEFLDYVTTMLEQFHGANDVKKEQTEKDAVQIMTMHGSKGLEFRNVIIPDLNEKNVPHKKAERMEEIEEERRLLYVAMTRAKERLFLFYVNSKVELKEPSRFLRVLE